MGRQESPQLIERKTQVDTDAQETLLVEGCGFFVSDIISEVIFEPFWLMSPGLRPNC